MVHNSIEEIKWQPVDGLSGAGQLTLSEFVTAVERGTINPSGGYGFYSLTQMVSNVPCLPQEISAGNVDRRFTHVVWFSK